MDTSGHISFARRIANQIDASMAAGQSRPLSTY
jgi:hypothetical protein